MGKHLSHFHSFYLPLFLIDFLTQYPRVFRFSRATSHVSGWVGLVKLILNSINSDHGHIKCTISLSMHSCKLKKNQSTLRVIAHTRFPFKKRNGVGVSFNSDSSVYVML